MRLLELQLLLWLVNVHLLKCGCCFRFTIVHTNDIHARYDPISENGDKCQEGDDERGLCFGGIGRVAAAVAQARSEGPAIYLNAGDLFQGTLWYTIYRGSLAADLMNLLSPDAMSLGNHELDDNVDGILPFLEKVQFPIVCCNLDLQAEPRLQEAQQLVRSTIVTKFDRKIGIIGYLTPNTQYFVEPNNIKYHREIPSINVEASNLREQGVDIIIALGHSGYAMDQRIAEYCTDVDVVVGGHSHSFLYTGDPPADDYIEGNYPTVVTNLNGKRVPVVQAYAYTKYLGNLSLEFNQKGNLIGFSGTPILLNQSYTASAEVTALLDSRRQFIAEFESQPVGTTMVHLNGRRESCRRQECNLGNLIADSMVYGQLSHNSGVKCWTSAAIAVINAGAIRASVDADASGTVTGGDVISMLPFGNALSYSYLKGKYLKRSLEHAAALRAGSANGGFLQVSGIRVKYDYNRPQGKQATSVWVLCADCKIPHFQRLQRHKRYGIVVPTFLLNGGDGHNFRDPENETVAHLNMTDREALIKYFQEHRIVYPSRENRILINERKISAANALQVSGPSLILVYTFYYILYE